MTDPSPFINALLGRAVSDVWLCPAGPGLSIDFDRPKPNYAKEASAISGDLNLMIDSDWRIEDRHSILLGSAGNKECWPNVRHELIGTHVTNVELFGHVPELYISFSNGLYVISFSAEQAEQPGWTILNGNNYLCVREGKLSTDACDCMLM